jgi:triosephosphate isomerase
MTTARPSRTSSRRSPSSSGSTRTGKSSSTATSTPSAPGRNAPASPSRTDHAPLGAPLFVLNLKAYPNCLGPGAAKIGTALAKESHRLGISVAICPSAPDLGTLAALLPVPVLAQHVDPEDPGAHTGSIVAEALAASGVSGSLLNHSEHPMAEDDLGRVVAHLQSLGLVPVVCAKDVDDSRRLARSRPAYLAVEPPELIGGDRSVATARPEVVRDAVAAVREVSPATRVLCGAGVRDRNDVRIALELGAVGVLVASAVTRVADCDEAIGELLAGYPTRHPSPRP